MAINSKKGDENRKLHTQIIERNSQLSTLYPHFEGFKLGPIKLCITCKTDYKGFLFTLLTTITFNPAQYLWANSFILA